MEKRTNYEDWYMGRDGVAECFTIGEGDHWSAGAEIGGIIYYYHPYSNNSRKGLVIIGVNKFSSILNMICDSSMGRLEVFGNYCPCTVQALKDGMEPRLDRGTLAEIGGYWQLMKSIDFDFPKKVQELGYEMMYDSIIINTAVDLTKLFNIIWEEIDKFPGFSTLDEAKILAKNVLPGVRVGARIGSALAGLGI